jgi:hypothetical protein
MLRISFAPESKGDDAMTRPLRMTKRSESGAQLMRAAGAETV